VTQNSDGSYSLTYGTPYSVLASVTGVGFTTGGVNLGTPTLTYYVGTNTSGNGSSTAPSDVGTYTVVASYAGSTDYTSASASATFTILPATPQITFSGSGYSSTGNSYSFTYDGQGHGASAGVTGVGDASLGSATLTYYQGSYASLTALNAAIAANTAVQLSAAPTGAGSYTVLASYAGSTDYAAASTIAGISIARATTSLSNLTVQQIILGTNTTTLSGELTSNTILPVGQSVSITLNGVTHSATVRTDGTFSANFATGALGVGQYAITYSYPGDANFTAASGAGQLTVAYGPTLLFDNSRIVNAGSNLPVKLELTNASGADISSSSIVVTATSLVGPGGVPVPLQSTGNSNPNNVFRYDATLGGYIFNLNTTGLASGTYTLYYTAGNDPTRHSLTFVIG
jgi:hypothetical protein